MKQDDQLVKNYFTLLLFLSRPENNSYIFVLRSKNKRNQKVKGNFRLICIDLTVLGDREVYELM